MKRVIIPYEKCGRSYLLMEIMEDEKIKPLTEFEQWCHLNCYSNEDNFRDKNKRTEAFKYENRIKHIQIINYKLKLTKQHTTFQSQYFIIYKDMYQWLEFIKPYNNYIFKKEKISVNPAFVPGKTYLDSGKSYLDLEPDSICFEMVITHNCQEEMEDTEYLLLILRRFDNYIQTEILPYIKIPNKKRNKKSRYIKF